MPGTTRKTAPKAAVADAAVVEAVRPDLTASQLQDYLVDLLDWVTLRDSSEKPRLRSALTGEEVLENADEEGEGEVDGEG